MPNVLEDNQLTQSRNVFRPLEEILAWIVMIIKIENLIASQAQCWILAFCLIDIKQNDSKWIFQTTSSEKLLYSESNLESHLESSL